VDDVKIFKAYYLVALRIKLRSHKVAHGKKIRGNRIIVKNLGQIIVGDHVSLNSFPGGEPYKTALKTYCENAVLKIGNHCNLNGTMIYCRDSVSIGDFCMFGPGCKIVDNDSHRVVRDVFERRKSPQSAPIVIRNNVWIGMHSLVLKGVEIGQNSIVAAYSVVTKDVPPNTIVAGNPAKPVKELLG
jgi:maltose O-acetyltransferase